MAICRPHYRCPRSCTGLPTQLTCISPSGITNESSPGLSHCVVRVSVSRRGGQQSIAQTWPHRTQSEVYTFRPLHPSIASSSIVPLTVIVALVIACGVGKLPPFAIWRSRNTVQGVSKRHEIALSCPGHDTGSWMTYTNAPTGGSQLHCPGRLSAYGTVRIRAWLLGQSGQRAEFYTYLKQGTRRRRGGSVESAHGAVATRPSPARHAPWGQRW